MSYYLSTSSHLMDDNDDLRRLKVLGGGASGEVYLVFSVQSFQLM